MGSETLGRRIRMEAVPEFELVVAINGGNSGDFRIWIPWKDEVMPEFIVGAIEE